MKAILFDLGKTIFDNYSFNFKKGFDKVLEYSTYHGDITSYFTDLIKKLNARTFKEIRLIDELKEMEEALDFKFTKSLDELEIIFFNEAEYDHLIDGVKDAVEFLYNEGFYLAVVSNSTFTSNALSVKLKEFDLLKYFKFVYSSADCGYRKPHQEIFESAKKKVYKDFPVIDELYYIGNDYNIDVVGSMNAGFKPIWLNIEQFVKTDNVAFLEIHSYQELISFIDKNK